MIAPRTITAPYQAPTAAALTDRIAVLLARPAKDLSIADLLELAADAVNRDTWELIGRSAHVRAICDAFVQIEATAAIERDRLQHELSTVSGERDAAERALHGARALLLDRGIRKAAADARTTPEAVTAQLAEHPGNPLPWSACPEVAGAQQFRDDEPDDTMVAQDEYRAAESGR